MSESMAAVIGLSALTFLLKGAGSLVGRIPEPLARRLGGLAPALLAGLVVTELFGPGGTPHVDAKAAGVAVALVLAWRRAPLAVTVIAGAAVAALLRALT
jgi:branched-subunit amino acid transport protein